MEPYYNVFPLPHMTQLLHGMKRFCISFLGTACMVLFFLPASLKAQINTDKVTLMGRNALSMDDYVTAIHYFNQVIEAKPHLYAPYYYRAYAKFSLEDYAGAEADCSSSLRLNPYMGEVYQLRGLCRIHNENFQGAIDDYTLSLREEPDDQGALYNRALCRLELKDFQTADKDIDYILSKWKNFQRAYLIKAQIAIEQKDTAQGIVWVDSLLHINPRNENAWSLKGRFALMQEHYPLADSCLTQAIQLNPNKFEHYILRAQVRHNLNRFALALNDYDRTIELVPEHFVAHYNRGLLRALVGDKNRAIKDFDFILKVEPDNTLARYNRALLREETGDYKGAIADYTQLIHTYPQFTYGYMARAACRRKIGDTNGAIKDESFVARAQLDLKYKPHKRQPIKQVRKRSEHSLEQYQQLVEETPDTTRRYVNQLVGKIQNRKVEQSPLPLFTLDFRTPDKVTGFNSPAFLPEVERINRRKYLPVPLTFEASNERTRPVDELESAIALLGQQSPQADIHLLRSVAYAASYNYEEAIKDIDRAIALDTACYLYPLHRAALHVAMYQSALADKEEKRSSETILATAREKRNQQMLTLALDDLNRALARSPKNAYILYNRGCLQLMLQQTAAALADFNAAIATDPHLAEGRYNRAILYLKTGQAEKAIPDLSRAGQDGLYKAYNLLKQANRLKEEGKKETKQEND